MSQCQSHRAFKLTFILCLKMSLRNFSKISPGDISICEKNGQICTLPIDEIDISGFHPGLVRLIVYLNYQCFKL